MSTNANENGQQNVGKLLEIKGVVVDAVFPGKLPGDLLRAADHPPRRHTS